MPRMVRADPSARYLHDFTFDRGKRPSSASYNLFLLRRRGLGCIRCPELNPGTAVRKMRRSQKRFKGTVNFYALFRSNPFGSMRELDIRPGVSFTDDFDQSGCYSFYGCAVLAIVGHERSLQFGIE